MEWLVIAGTFCILAAVGVLYALVNPTWKSACVLLLFCAPLAIALWFVGALAYSEDLSRSFPLPLASPFVIAAVDLALLWAWFNRRDPETTSDVTTAVGLTFLGLGAANAYQKRRDAQRARAFADELERRNK